MSPCGDRGVAQREAVRMDSAKWRADKGFFERTVRETPVM
jgi:hypothetical protein